MRYVHVVYCDDEECHYFDTLTDADSYDRMQRHMDLGHCVKTERKRGGVS